MLSLVASRSVQVACRGVAAVPKRFAGSGYMMRPPRGFLDDVDSDFDFQNKSRLREEERSRIFDNYLKECMKDANDLGADPDPQWRKERLKPKLRRQYAINKAEGRAANQRVRSLVELIYFKRERNMK